MVSVISEWLQKRMPSYREIESKVTKEQIENNKDFVQTLKVNSCIIFPFLCLQLYVSIYTDYTDFFGERAILPGILALIVNIITILLSIILPIKFNVLKYHIHMLMVMISMVALEIDIFAIVLDSTPGLIIKIILLAVMIISIKSLNWAFDCGVIFCFVTEVIERFYGQMDFSISREAMVSVVILLMFFKMGPVAMEEHCYTLFYILTYPEEFRRKLGYSVKEWYGRYSPQYRKERDFL